MLKRAARRLLPAPVYRAGKSWAQQWRRHEYRRLAEVSEARMRQILAEELGIGPGMVVFVHSALDRIRLGFPFFRVLALLREAVGQEGTLLFPATHLRQRPEVWLGRGEVFDARQSPTSMGLLPELARRQAGAARSLHPTHSVVALGKGAVELTGEHHAALYPCGAQSPYYRLVERNGLIVGLGVDVDVLTFAHCVEDIWGERFPVQTRRAQVYAARVRDGEGREQVVQTLVAHPRIRWREMAGYVRQHVSEEVCRRMEINGARYYRAEAQKLYARMEELAGRGVTMYSRLVHRGHPLEPLMSRLAERLEER
jgi:aminoglycoside N3'-acetyltransferase